ETIPQIAMGQYVNDTTYINMPLGMIDTQSVRVCLSLVGDEDTTNNCRNGDFKLYPAYDLRAVQTVVTTSACRMKNVPVSISVINAGRKTIPTNLSLEIGYEITLLSQGVTLRNIPYTFVDTINLSSSLAVGATRQISFAHNADMYPWDTLMDVRLSVRSWAKLQHDLKFANDTTAAVTVTSKHTPATPVGVDQTIPYATLVSLNASQSQNRPLRWSKDSNSTPFYAPTNYLTSTTYSHPNLLFRDTTFYLSSISSTGCTSYFAPIHVFVNNPVPYDASVAQITEPLAKVYMDYDTVKVRIKNYGSQTLTSIPVTYTVHENNNGSLLQIVTETCSTTIAPQGEYVYKFNTLPNFPNLQNWSYTITAWTNLQGEMTRSNDTAMLTVTPINENNYILSWNKWDTWKFQTQSTNKAFLTVHFGETWIDHDGNTEIPENEWHHVVATIDLTAGAMAFYLDGELTMLWNSENENRLVPNQTFAHAPEGTVLFVGLQDADSLGGDSRSWYVGKLDDLQFYTIALDGGQVSKLFNDQK
ncbi:MAG: LamG domain-containing protein, partial [Bacteroidales bacterium]|nr:LamG domain-containing protein [Bacteroidales bacterium]